MKKLFRQRAGFSLVETVVVIIILGIALTPFSILVVNVMVQNVQSQGWATAAALAEAESEKITAVPFSDIVNSGPTTFSAPFAAYTSQIIVDYVNPNALDTVVAGPTDYKRVKVQVANSIIGTVRVTTLVTNNW